MAHDNAAPSAQDVVPGGDRLARSAQQTPEPAPALLGPDDLPGWTCANCATGQPAAPTTVRGLRHQS